ncbi:MULTISPECIES: response regulator transcription factor [Priestia]|uniref:response regulator transcription factor n=1 Tax=Priestia TaxID=2800373 RepID=UPI0011B688EE|nr:MULTISPECIES: response regulator transcription factor [Priestia]MCG0050204.1 response regulator transcription factor [Priestia aryabhattai]QDZ84656.1 DNA-binding response regulator [Priestia megaterium]
MDKRILIVDDEEDIAELLEDFLSIEGYEIYKATNGTSAKKILSEVDIDFILLDIMMPEESGFTLCKSLREIYSIPIIFLSALQDDTDKIRGLNIGADDYIVKDATPGEIVARIKAIERRLNNFDTQSKNKKNNIIRFKSLELNIMTRSLLIENEKITLTAKEFDLIKLFLTYPNQVFTYDQIIEKIWGYNQGDFHSVRVYIGKLREKIEEKTNDFKISTVWGVGYKAEGVSSE